jgi:multisubunit Na+/H+ antiporter MnhG subunit
LEDVLKRRDVTTSAASLGVVIVMLGIAALLLVKQQQIRRLETENADLRAQLNQMA